MFKLKNIEISYINIVIKYYNYNLNINNIIIDNN